MARHHGQIDKAILGSYENPIIARKNWLTFSAELCGIFTFIMVAIIFFAGIAVAVEIGGTVTKTTQIIDDLKKHIEKYVKIIDQLLAKLKVRIEESDIPEKVESAVASASSAVKKKMSAPENASRRAAWSRRTSGISAK